VAAALFARAVGLAWMLVLFGIKCLTAAPVPSATVTGNSILGCRQSPGYPAMCSLRTQLVLGVVPLGRWAAAAQHKLHTPVPASTLSRVYTSLGCVATASAVACTVDSSCTARCTCSP